MEEYRKPETAVAELDAIFTFATSRQFVQLMNGIFDV